MSWLLLRLVNKRDDDDDDDDDDHKYQDHYFPTISFSRTRFGFAK